MLPSRGYFNSLECPFYMSSTDCQRPYCHFKHPKKDAKQDNAENKAENAVQLPAAEAKPNAAAPGVPVVAPVKHIPIASMPTKPAAISVKKKIKPYRPQYVPTVVTKNDSGKKSNVFQTLGYEPSPVVDSSEKTYSRYSYEKGHDSGDEIMENHKSIIETNHLKLDDGSKSGYDEEMDDSSKEVPLSPSVSLDGEEADTTVADDALVAAFSDKSGSVASPVEHVKTIPDEQVPKLSKCKKKRKYADISKTESEAVEKREEKKQDKSEKLNAKDHGKHSSSKRIKVHGEPEHSNRSSTGYEADCTEAADIDANRCSNGSPLKKHVANSSGESECKKPEKKQCKFKDKKKSSDSAKHSPETENNIDVKDKHESKKHSGSKKLYTNDDRKHLSDKKDESRHSSKTDSKEHKGQSSIVKKKQDSKSKSTSESNRKHLKSGKTHSEKESSSSSKQISEKKSQSGERKLTSSSGDKHSSSGKKTHSSSNHKKEKEHEKSSSDKSKKHSSESRSKSSSSSKSHSSERKHSEKNKKLAEKKSSKDRSKHSKHKSDSDKKESKSKSSNSRHPDVHESNATKNNRKRKHSVSESSGSVVSGDEKKDTILILDSSGSDAESFGRSISPPRVEDLLGLNVSDDTDKSDHWSESEDESKYTPKPVSTSRASPVYKPSPVKTSDDRSHFKQVPAPAVDDCSVGKPFKVRIAHVPNVSSLLSAKSLISSGRTVPPALHKIVTATRIINNPKNLAKTEIATASTSRTRPQVTTNLDSVIPLTFRQPGLNNIFDEFIKFIDYHSAYQRSVDEETEICNVATNPQSYRNRIALCILKIRKSKGAADVVNKEKLTSSSIPDYTYGLPLYECFSKYLLKPEEYVLHGYPLELPGKPGCVYIDKNSHYRNKKTGPTEGPFRKCLNCGQEYAVDEETGMPLTTDDCHHHWGKPIGMRQGKIYTCCKSEVGSEPCHISKYHVTELKNDDCLEGYVRTRPYPEDADPNKAGIYAMDCEMCFTTQGRDIVRASLLAVDNESVYDVLIKPKYPVLDYCTRFSGITEEKLANVTTSLEDVQKFLLKTLSDKTILVGHSLENDLKALKLIHYNVVDTSIMYPHKEGLPVKCALRTLCSRILGSAIQTGEHGHDSLEDARGCLQLVLHQIREDCKSRKPRVVKQLKSK